MRDNTPNLFNWATSELSQDAFICWLISCINNDEKQNLNKTAKHFLNELTDNKFKAFNSVKIRRQFKKIDIVIEFNNDKVILIEDKVSTKNHSNQLERYFKILSKKYEKENIFPVYFKTGDQSSYSKIQELGYKIFLRKDFLRILEYGREQNITNNIFIDYYNYLSKIQQDFESFRTLPPKNWSSKSWQGFYSELKERLGEGYWDYVPQKNGGFFGLWWFHQEGEFEGIKFRYYLQLEQRKFCIKLQLCDFNRKDGYKVRDVLRKRLFERFKNSDVRVYKNGRIGKTMTIVALKDDYLRTDENGIVNIESIITIIKKVENLIINLI